MAILESPILSFKIGHLGQDTGQNENRWLVRLCCAGMWYHGLREVNLFDDHTVILNKCRPGNVALASQMNKRGG
jgi:hypothetical protein